MTETTPDLPVNEDGLNHIVTPGDMGTFELVKVATDAEGKDVFARRQTGVATYTGGYNTDGTPTLAVGRIETTFRDPPPPRTPEVVFVEVLVGAGSSGDGPPE